MFFSTGGVPYGVPVGADDARVGGMFGGGSVQMLGSSGRMSHDAMYRSHVWVSVAVNRLARGMARTPLKAYEDDGSDYERRRLKSRGRESHPLAALIARPWRGGTTFRLLNALGVEYGIHGSSLVWMDRPTPGALPERLIPMRTRQVVAQYRSDGAIGFYEWRERVGADPVRILPEDVMVVGFEDRVSPLEALARSLQLDEAAQRSIAAFYEHGARPGGVFVTDRKLQPEEVERAEETLRSDHGGASNHFRTLLLANMPGAQWLTPQTSSKDAETAEHRRLAREEVLAGYYIPQPIAGVLDRATFCLPARALVLTEEGPRPIDGVSAGDRVWSHAGDRWELRRVLRSAQTGVDPILRIKTGNRTLECNETHPILCRREVREPWGDRYRVRYEHQYVPAGQLQMGDVMVALGRLPEMNGGSAAHAESVQMMELMGLYVGDGNLMRNRGNLTGIAISRASNAAYMDHYRGALGKIRGRDGAALLQEQERSTRVSSAHTARVVEALGFGGTAHTKRVPGWLFGCSEELRLAFLRGFLDADGSVDKKGRISFSSCNSALLADIRHLCMSVGVPVTNPTHTQGSTTLPNGKTCSVSQHAFTCSDPGANARIGSHDPRYQERLADGKPFGAKLNKYNPVGRGRADLAPPAGCCYTRITRIDHKPAEPVFDIEVEGTHNFIADGVVVHNSNIDTQTRMWVMDTLGEHFKMIESAFNGQLIDAHPEWEGCFLEFDPSEILRGAPLQRAEAYLKWLNAGVRTPNELRRLENLPPIDDAWADAIYVPVNLTPAGLPGGMSSTGEVSPNGLVRRVQVLPPDAPGAVTAFLDDGERDGL